MSNMAMPPVDNPLSLALTIAASLVLLYGIAHNGAQNQKLKMEAEYRRRYPDLPPKTIPDSHVRSSALLAIVLLVVVAGGCFLSMLAFKLVY